MKGNLYLIPTTLGDCEPLEVLPISIKNTIELIDVYIVENEKTARRFIKKIAPQKVQANLKISLIDKHVNPNDIKSYLDVCEKGISVGLLSEAGVPAIADPGANVVSLAHNKGIRVVPLVGPSSIILAMMASGFNGQNFAFNGYLPIDKIEKKQQLKEFEKLAFDKNQSQIFIETPYRNNKLLADLLVMLHPETQLCIAMDITLPTEFIATKRIKDWKKTPLEMHKRPAIFILHK